MSFDELGLTAELAAAAARLGYEDPTPLQSAAIPVLRRGGNVVLHASSGAGLTAAYGLALLDRLAGLVAESPGAELRALVIVPSVERASRVADMLACLASDTDLRVRAHAPGWRRGPSDVLVSTADAALRSVRDSSLKLDRLETFVLENAAAVLALEAPETVGALAVAIRPEAQRVVTAHETRGDVDAFVQAHVRRAIDIPPRPAATATTPPPAGSRGSLSYLVVAGRDKIDALAELLGRRSESPRVVIARTAERAESVRDHLLRRGFTIAAEPGEPDAVTVKGALDARHATFAYDVPADPRVLERLEPGVGVVFVTAVELPHLRQLAAETGFDIVSIERRKRRDRLAAFRESVRRAIRAEDADAQLLVLDPLFDEFSAAEIAAALSVMARAREPARDAPASPDAAPAEPSRPAPFVRLFVSVGEKDALRPADIVGAFTGEAKIQGDQIGRIEIRDTFSVVEVDSSIAERIIRALNGTTMKGRSVRVDFDRKTTTPARRAPRPRS